MSMRGSQRAFRGNQRVRAPVCGNGARGPRALQSSLLTTLSRSELLVRYFARATVTVKMIRIASAPDREAENHHFQRHIDGIAVAHGAEVNVVCGGMNTDLARELGVTRVIA